MNDARRQGVMESIWPAQNHYGFIAEDTGQIWLVTSDQLPDGLTRLDRGTAVTFTGDPTTIKPLGHYPYASAIELDTQPAQPG